MRKRVESLDRNTDRIIGIDILRIVAMAMIVILHCFNVGGILSGVNKESFNYYFYYFIFICVFCGVNLYALTTGYLCVCSRHKFSRIINLWIEVIFWSIIIATIFFVLPQYHVSLWDYIFSFFPLLSNRYWYFTAYFLLFVFMPLINAGIKNITKTQYKTLLIALFIICSIFQCIGSVIGYFSLDVYFENSGLSFVWIFIMYLFGAYIRIYGIKIKRNICILLYFVFSLCTLITIVMKNLLSSKFAFVGNLNILSYSFPFIVLASFSLFLFFTQINPKRCNKGIILLSSLTFSVYIIANHPLSALIQKDLFAETANNVGITLIYVLIYSIISYAGAMVLGFVQKKVFMAFKVNSTIDRIIERIHNK